ncbi:MAG: MGMT family protein [Spirulinaceae cyanobacterium]
MTAYDRIYDIVRQIPEGQVATYGQVAALAGYGGQARLVGYALYRVTEALALPWHRVVNARGQVSHSPHRYGSDDYQYQLLQQEGIEFDAQGRLSLAAYQWQGKVTGSKRAADPYQDLTHPSARVAQSTKP